MDGKLKGCMLSDGSMAQGVQEHMDEAGRLEGFVERIYHGALVR